MDISNMTNDDISIQKDSLHRMFNRQVGKVILIALVLFFAIAPVSAGIVGSVIKKGVVEAAVRYGPGIAVNAVVSGSTDPVFRHEAKRQIGRFIAKFPRYAESGKKLMQRIDQEKISRLKFVSVSPDFVGAHAFHEKTSEGMARAERFATRFGLHEELHVELSKLIFHRVKELPAGFLRTTDKGDIYVVNIPVEGPTGNGVVQTQWLYTDGAPHLYLVALDVRKK